MVWPLRSPYFQNPSHLFLFFSMMSSTRDRTSEFFSIADRLGGSVGASASGGGGAGAGSGLAPRGLSGSSLGSSSLSGAALSKVDSSLFASKASSIGMGIHATSTKLARLAALAKRTSMFDDPAREIAELTGVIKQDIASLNAAISDLQNLSRGTSGSNKQTAAHGTTVVNNLKTKLMGAMKQFKEVLTVRNENLKVQESRRSRFTASPSKLPSQGDGGVRQPLLGAAPSSSPLPLGRYAAAASGGGDMAMPTPSTSDAAAAGASDKPPVRPPPHWATSSTQPTSVEPGGGHPHLRRRQQGGGSSVMVDNATGPPSSRAPTTPGMPPPPPMFQSQALVAQNSSYVSARSEAIAQVESTITELGGIFSQLATMVQEQGELAVRIDENVEDTLSNVEAGQGELLKYLDRISGNRWLILKVLGVVLFFLLIFVLFVL